MEVFKPPSLRSELDAIQLVFINPPLALSSPAIKNTKFSINYTQKADVAYQISNRDETKKTLINCGPV